MAKIDRAPQLLEFFLQEAEDHINEIDRGIAALASGSSPDPEMIERLFRSAHTLKGSAGFANLTVTSKVSHRMEDLFEEIRDGRRQPTPETVESLSFMLDAIKGLVLHASQGKGDQPEQLDDILRTADEILAKTSGKESGDGSPEAGSPPSRRREDHEFFTGNFVKLDLNKVEDLLTLIGEITIRKNHLLQLARQTGEVSDELNFAGNRLVTEVKHFSDRYAYSLPEHTPYVDPLLAEFGDLEFDQYDELNLFSRKVQEISNDIAGALHEFSDFFETFTDDLRKIDRMMKMLRTSLSETRMIELGRLFQRFGRPVADLARTHGKKAEFSISGGETLIDKVIYERLFAPLMHMIRNAVDHGLESPEERQLAGKEPTCSLRLSGRKDGMSVVIELTDDGRGIDPGQVFRKAVERGIMQPDETPSREEILGLIFAPGFSTAASTGMTSGRGVGLNAVRQMVSEINGVLSVDSVPGRGTTFRIRVPSSLAITNVIIVRCGGVEFVIPASLIDEVIEFDQEGEASESHVLTVRDRNVRIRDLSEALGIAPHPAARKFLVICDISDRKMGLVVDGIMGQEETIIRPMKEFLSGLSVYSGVTISGNGQARFVLNPLQVFEHRHASGELVITPAAGTREKRVLVVDDSLSVRKYVTLFLEGKKIRALTATNGLEALELLKETPVDLIITDLEMPVMHGYEFIYRLKNTASLRKIPVIVLTSRSSGKHREKALEVGAEELLTKPFEEAELLAVLMQHGLLGEGVMEDAA